MRTALLLAFVFCCYALDAQVDTSKAKKDTIPRAVSDTPGLVGDTSSMLDELDMDEEPDYVQNTFKATRIINSHSTEMLGKHNLDYRICHRFDPLNTGAYNLWGLDKAYQRMSFTYGITDLINIEIGRSSVNKVYDATAKFKLMRQARGDKMRFMTVVYVANMAIQTLKNANEQYNPYYFTNRLYYTHQLLMSRKITKSFSLQLMPTLVHRNFVDSAKYKNNVYSIGIGGRNKVSRKCAITYEYFYVLPNQIKPIYKNSFSLGFDIETGGHVFQLNLTNSIGMNEKGFIAETTDNWLKGGIHFGFNISRVFYIGRRG